MRRLLRPRARLRGGGSQPLSSKCLRASLALVCLLATPIPVAVVGIDLSRPIHIAPSDPGSVDSLAFPSEQNAIIPVAPQPPPPSRERLLRQLPHRRKKQGRFTMGIQGSPALSSLRRIGSSNNDSNRNIVIKSYNSSTDATLQTDASFSMDPASTIQLARLGWAVMVSFTGAFSATLRILAPLILARRSINAAGDLAMDYLRGRYIRKTYSRMEQLYVNYYETPAAFRAFCRVVSQLTTLLTLSKIMGWMVGIDHAPCHVENSGLANWCGLLWIGAVIGTGHAFSTAVAVWGGPLRIQVAASYLHTGRIVMGRVLTRPWHILQWMHDPEQWITMVHVQKKYANAAPQDFEPNAIIFPATWVPLRIFQFIAVTWTTSSCPATWHSHKDPVSAIVKQYLIHLTLGDEWRRVFIGERRVGLSCFVAFAYLISTVSLVITASAISGASGLLLLPTLFAVIVSGWMNGVIFWNRLEGHNREKAIAVFYKRKEAALAALNL